MKQVKKKRNSVLIAFTLITILVSINLISAQTVVQKQPEQEQQRKGFFSSLWAGITNPIVLGVLFFAVIFVVIVFVIAIILVKIIRYLKLRTDLFYRMKNERIKNAKNQSRYLKSKAWWNINKNIPLRMVKKNEEGVLVITNPFAYYRGDYISHEGNVVIAMNIPNRKRWWIFPMVDLLILPNKENVDLTERKERGNEKVAKLRKIPLAKDLIQFLDNEILIYADSISFSGEFYFPVVKDTKGKIIDLAMPIFQSLKDVAIEDYLYTQTTEFVELSRKAMDINPNIRATQKIGDKSQSVEVPESRPR